MVAPGVTVTTAVRSGPTGTPRVNSGQYFVIGLAERGPTDRSVKINSMGDYRRIYGDRTTYGALFDDLTMFFESGGQQAVVLRVVGAAATTGTVQLKDGAGTPLNTVAVNAAAAGAWASRLQVVVAAGDNANTRKVTINLDGSPVESYNNLADVQTMVSRFAASPYVRLTDLGSVTAAPNNLPSVGTFVLSAGTDDRLSVDGARVGSKLAVFNSGDGDGAIAAPGFGSSVHAALLSHGAENRRVAILSAARGTSVNDLRILGLSVNANGQHGDIFAPHLVVGDGVGGTRVVPPDGYVAAARARTHDLTGPWASPAGEGSISGYVLGVDQEFSRADHELLDAGRISPIRVVSNRIRLYGWRSLSGNDTDYGSLTVQDTLNRISVECEARLEPFVHKTIDGRGQLFAAMAGVPIGVVEPIRASGGVFEKVDAASQEVVDPGYSVNVGPSLNTVESLQGNRVNAQVAVRLSPNAFSINLSIIKVGLTAAV